MNLKESPTSKGNEDTSAGLGSGIGHWLVSASAWSYFTPCPTVDPHQELQRAPTIASVDMLTKAGVCVCV